MTFKVNISLFKDESGRSGDTGHTTSQWLSWLRNLVVLIRSYSCVLAACSCGPLPCPPVHCVIPGRAAVHPPPHPSCSPKPRAFSLTSLSLQWRGVGSHTSPDPELSVDPLHLQGKAQAHWPQGFLGSDLSGASSIFAHCFSQHTDALSWRFSVLGLH